MIPFRYKDAKYEEVPKDIQAKFEVIRESRQGIYIHGGIGTGKTHIAYALNANSKDKAKLDSRFWNTTELLRELRLDFDRKPEDKEHEESELFNFRGLLFLDDIGAEKLSDWVLETFYLIVNKRYNEKLPTIFTSNMPIAELAERIGDRTTSRIVEMCDIIKLEGKDRRINGTTTKTTNQGEL